MRVGFPQCLLSHINCYFYELFVSSASLSIVVLVLDRVLFVTVVDCS